MASMVFDKKKRRNGLQLDKRDHFNYYSLFVLKVQLLFFFSHFLVVWPRFMAPELAIIYFKEYSLKILWRNILIT